nr:type II CRISPR-associated endonuclease Cas1 [Kiloniella laminariae]
MDISQDDRFLHFERNAIVICSAGEELGRLHLPDINSVIIHGHQCCLTVSLLVKLAEEGIPLTVCSGNHMPVSISLPVTGHHLQSRRARLQADCKRPLEKQIWKQIVARKILEQAATLSLQSDTMGHSLAKLAKIVKSGDPENVEARAARIYWQQLLGRNFRRDRNFPGLNSHLNYGYIIIRSAIARALTAAGLIPALGIHHKNAQNGFCLADDMMEVFRPYVDALVYFNRTIWTEELSPDAKSQLAGLVMQSVSVSGENTDLFRAMTLFVQSFVDILEIGDGKLLFPDHTAAHYLKQQELQL